MLNDLPELDADPDDDDPEDDEPEISSAARMYSAFSESDLGAKDPKTLAEAKRSTDWPEWEKVVQTKMDTLKQMGTWDLVDPPDDRKPVTNKWVFI
jgi:hypothetical protein